LPLLAQAQLSDPTRPPPAFTVTGEAGEMPTPTMTGLQSVILKKEGKPAALIDGVVVELGGKVGEARLVRVNEDSVVLRGPQGEETLRLIPAAEKKIEKKKVGAGETAKTATTKPAQHGSKGIDK
jgi:hypothetical protein